MDQSAANGPLQIPGLQLQRGTRGRTPAAPSAAAGEAAAFRTRLRGVAARDALPGQDGSPLPPAGADLPVLAPPEAYRTTRGAEPGLLPARSGLPSGTPDEPAPLDDALRIAAAASAGSGDETDIGIPPTAANAMGAALPATAAHAPAGGLPTLEDGPRVASARRAGPDPAAAGAAGGAVVPDRSGYRSPPPTLPLADPDGVVASGPPVRPELAQLVLQIEAGRQGPRQPAWRDAGPRTAPGLAQPDDAGPLRPVSGSGPFTFAAAGTDAVLRAGPDGRMAGPAGQLVDTAEVSELPFDSIRVTLREPGGERPVLGRGPVLELPAPRHPVGHPEWASSLGERLIVMVRGEHQMARLSLNPEHLGPVDLQLQINDDQARLLFTAQHPQAREALEAAMPRLREMFAQQGLDLSQQNAQGDGPARDRADGRPGSAAHYGPTPDDGNAPAGEYAAGGHLAGRRGLVDEFA